MVCKLPRKIITNVGIPVTITGTGDETKCYFTYNGIKYTSDGTLHIKEGNVITFCVMGNSSTSDTAYVNIDGTRVAYSSTSRLASYDWTIPENITNVNIKFILYGTYKLGRIMITTA